ncbi:MAG TPA: LPS export ABC transporter permease LptG [Steroidobacteraceae bacterium]|nr:LPS export ABC transporter permease LptG [Steroidobacteraceae bacterium]
MSLVDRYIVRAVLGATGLFMFVLLVLAVIITFIGEQGDIGQGQYSASSALLYALLNLPQEAWQLLPIGALMGSILGLGTLARGNELIVLRASGISVARIAGSALFAGLILLAIAIVLGELLAPPLTEAARQVKAGERFSNVSFGGPGAWVRDGNLILEVEQRAGTRQFGSMLVFELSPDHRLIAVGRAARASAGPKNQWVLSGYTESRFTPDRVSVDPPADRTFSSNVSADFLRLVMSNPGDLAAAALWRLIEHYQSNALDPKVYVFAFWSRIARTLAIGFAVMLAVPFVLGPLRSAGGATRMVVGLLLGIGFFLLQRLIESGTIVFDLNPIVLAWLPTTLLATVTLALLARAR